MHPSTIAAPTLHVGDFTQLENLALSVTRLRDRHPSWRQVVLVILYNPHLNSFLLTRPQAAVAANEFNANPVQGGIKGYEHPHAACIRELTEEIGFSDDEAEFTYLGSELQAIATDRGKSDDWTHQLFHVYFCQSAQTNFVADEAEVAAIEWHSAALLPQTVNAFMSEQKRSVWGHGITSALTRKLLPYHCESAIAA